MLGIGIELSVVANRVGIPHARPAHSSRMVPFAKIPISVCRDGSIMCLAQAGNHRRENYCLFFAHKQAVTHRRCMIF